MKWSVISIFILLFLLFGVLPRASEMWMNRVAQDKLIPVTDAAQLLHYDLIISDLHADSLLFGRNLTVRGYRGHLDLPRMRRGGIDLQAFSVVTKTPRGLNYEKNSSDSDNITLVAFFGLWPPRTWFCLRERALYQAGRLQHLADDPDHHFMMVRSVADLDDFKKRRVKDPELLAGWLGMEGAHPFEGKIENVQTMYDAGYRYIGLVHFFDNDVAGSAHGEIKGGLTPFGRDLVKQLEARNMIIDLAHSSPQTVDEVIAMATRPLLVSHTGLRGNCDNQRNLSDDRARAIAAKGGLIGIGFWEAAVCGSDARAIAKTIHYAVNVVGEDHVALGSDFDGATTVPFDAGNMVQLTQALLDEGLSPEVIHKVMGDNVMDFLRANLPKK